MHQGIERFHPLSALKTGALPLSYQVCMHARNARSLLSAPMHTRCSIPAAEKEKKIANEMSQIRLSCT